MLAEVASSSEPFVKGYVPSPLALGFLFPPQIPNESGE